jgi:hypothetical protein
MLLQVCPRPVGDMNLEKFFDKANHDGFMELLYKRIGDNYPVAISIKFRGGDRYCSVIISLKVHV